MEALLHTAWGQALQSADVALFRLINLNQPHPVLDALMAGFTQLGLGHVQLLLIALLALRGGKTGRRVALLCVVAFVLSGIASQVIKHAVERPRPAMVVPDVRFVLETLKWKSFPSGHTATSFALAVVAGARYRRWLAPLLVVAALVGCSRVYIGVHFPGDALGGALLGAATGFACLLAGRGRRAAPPPERAARPEEEPLLARGE